jgi:uncharacterized protein YecE (DUF72 family)
METTGSDSREPAPVYTGAMDWQIKDWRGVFYARDTPPSESLEQYSHVLPAIEINATFHHRTEASLLERWNQQTPEQFRFTAKLWGGVTHKRRLMGSATDIAIDFGKRLAIGLGEKLSGIVIQLPPDFTASYEKTLVEFVDALASTNSGVGHLPWGVELRSGSWLKTGIAPFLADRGFFCVTTERLDFGGPLRYIRLLGTQDSVTRFDKRQFDRTPELAAWAKRTDIARRASPEPIYFFVRNYFEGYAPGTIAVLRKHLGLPNFRPPGQLQLNLFDEE